MTPHGLQGLRPGGIPEIVRARKALQCAGGIDDFGRIMRVGEVAPGRGAGREEDPACRRQAPAVSRGADGPSGGRALLPRPYSFRRL
jgi:hypothetical protein